MVMNIDLSGMLDRLNELSIAVRACCDELARIIKDGN